MSGIESWYFFTVLHDSLQAFCTEKYKRYINILLFIISIIIIITSYIWLKLKAFK